MWCLFFFGGNVCFHRKNHFPSESQCGRFSNSERIARPAVVLSRIRNAVSTAGALGRLESLLCQILSGERGGGGTSSSPVVFNTFSSQEIRGVLGIVKVVSRPLSPRFILLVSVLSGGECFVSEAVQMSTQFSSGFERVASGHLVSFIPVSCLQCISFAGFLRYLLCF